MSRKKEQFVNILKQNGVKPQLLSDEPILNSQVIKKKYQKVISGGADRDREELKFKKTNDFDKSSYYKIDAPGGPIGF